MGLAANVKLYLIIPLYNSNYMRYFIVSKIERLTSINGRIDTKIDKNIKTLIGTGIKPGPARSPYKLKGAFYLNLKKNKT